MGLTDLWTRKKPEPASISNVSMQEFLDRYEIVAIEEEKGKEFAVVTQRQAPLDSELGSTSPSPWTSFNRREYNPKLAGRQGLEVCEKMRKSDGGIRGTLRLFKTPVLSADWYIEPGGKKLKDKKAADFVWKNLTELMSISWTQVLTEALLMVDFGYYCVDPDTEILTREGWKRYDQIAVGDEVRTLNPETGLAEWQALEAVNVFTGKHDMLRLKTREHDSFSTMDHNWVTRAADTGQIRFKKSAQLNKNDNIIRAAAGADLPVEAKYSDDFVELVAWFFTEGRTHHDGTAHIYQSQKVNPAYCDRIRGCLDRLGFRYSEYVEHDGDLLHWYIPSEFGRLLNEVAPWRVVRGDFINSLTHAQLRLFVDTALDGDRSGEGLHQKDPAMLDAFEMALALLGVPCNRHKQGEGWRVSVGKQMHSRPLLHNSNEATSYEGIVWCPTVSNRTWLARRNGSVYYTGNCFEKVYERRVVDGVVRDVWKKLAPRHPMDVEEWVFDKNGGPVGCWFTATPEDAEAWRNEYMGGMNATQTVNMPGQSNTPPQNVSGLPELANLNLHPYAIFIPIERLVVFTFDKEAGNIEGTSVLRSAYKHWYYKEQLYKIDAIQKERHGIGIPVIKLPMGYKDEDKQAAENLGRNIRTNERAHIVLPPGWEVMMLKLEGNPVDAMKSIEHHDKMIEKNIVAYFLHASGTEAETLVDIYLKSVQFTADIVAETFNMYCIPQLVGYNFPGAAIPKLKYRHISEAVDWRTMSFAIRNFIGAGVIRPDDKLEDNIREGLGLPKADPDTVRIVQSPQAGPLGGGSPKPSPSAPGLPRVGPPRQAPVGKQRNTQGLPKSDAGRDNSGGGR